MRIFIFIVLSVISGLANSWEITQVKINHVQTASTESLIDHFYITVGTTAETKSGCTQVWGKKNWLGFKIDTTNEKQKLLISMILTAYASGTLVDVGSSVTGCIANAPVAKLDYVRVGNYR